jgi:hypothetical protein
MYVIIAHLVAALHCRILLEMKKINVLDILNIIFGIKNIYFKSEKTKYM